MLIAVTGMRREGRLLGRIDDVVVSGGSNAGLSEKIEAAVARGGRAIVSVGICGGLAPEIGVGTIVVGSEIAWKGTRLPVDETWRTGIAARIQECVCGTIAGTDTILIRPEGKATLYRETKALVADMESHIAAKVAAEHRLPFAALRVVSDGARDAMPSAVLGAIGNDGKVMLGPVLRAVAREPQSIPDLIRLGRDTSRAMAGLLRCLNLLGPGLGCPYLGQLVLDMA